MRLRRQVPVRQTVIWCLSYIEWNWIFQMLKRGAWENMEQSLPRNMCADRDQFVLPLKTVAGLHLIWVSEHIETLPIRLNLQDDKFKNDLLWEFGQHRSSTNKLSTQQQPEMGWWRSWMRAILSQLCLASLAHPSNSTDRCPPALLGYCPTNKGGH